MINQLFQENLKEELKRRIITFLSSESISKDLKLLLEQIFQLLSKNVRWIDIEYKKGNQICLRRKDLDENNFSIPFQIFGKLIPEYIVSKIDSSAQSKNIEKIFVWGSYVDDINGVYSSDLDLVIALRDNINDKDLEKLKKEINSFMLPLSKALGKGVSDLVQLQKVSSTVNSNYVKSRVLKLYT